MPTAGGGAGTPSAPDDGHVTPMVQGRASAPTFIERALRADKIHTLVLLFVLPALCWAWIIVMARDMYGPMTGASRWMMTMTWDAAHLFLLWAMWAVMMTGMMLPSAAPVILLYAATVRRREQGDAALGIYALAGGYLFVWASFSVLATALQRVLAGLLVLTPMMEVASPRAAALLLVAAGGYQLMPFKRACLTACQTPLGVLMRHWREGRAGAFRIGLRHGLYCVGCCWALMLLLFAGGVMNLTVIGGLTVFVLSEKFGLLGRQGGRISGALLIALAVWMLAS